MSDEVKTRVSIEGADQAVTDVKRVNEAERQRAEATKKATLETQEATRASEQASKAQKELGASTESTVAGWLKMIAIGGTITALLESFRDRAREAVQQMERLAELSSGLATNVGGRVSDELLASIDHISMNAGIGVRGRDSLIEAMGAATDARNMDPLQQESLARQLAELDQATGLRGKQAFNTMNAISSVFNYSDDQAVAILTGMTNQGFGADVTQNAVERGRDPRWLALMQMARKDLDTETIGRQFQGLVSALDRRGEDGELAEDLQGLGVTNEMSPFDRWAFLNAALDRGDINEAQFSQATGGQATVAFRKPIREAMRSGGLRDATDNLFVSPQGEIAKRLQSPRQKANQTLNRAKLYKQIQLENEGLDPASIADLQLDTAYSGGDQMPKWLQFLYKIPVARQTIQGGNYVASRFAGDQQVENVGQRMTDEIGKRPVIINNYNNSILHGTDPAKAPDDVKRQD